jgi:hypothetical protein
MDIRSLPAVLQGASSPATPVPNVSSAVRNVLTNIATLPNLSDAQRSSLVAATATASQIVDITISEVQLETISSTGIYLSNTSGTSWPRWQVLTALRAYGLNLTEKPVAPAPQAVQAPYAQVVAQVQAQLNTLVQEARTAAPQQAQAVSQKAAAPVVQQQTVAQAPAPTAKPAPKPAAISQTNVDTLV